MEHRTEQCCCSNRRVVCAALATGSDVRGSTGALERGGAAPLVGSGDRAHHTGAAGTVFAGHFVSRSAPPRPGSGLPASGVVPERLPTFSDELALVRQQLWPVSISWMSGAEGEVVIIPKALFERLTNALAYAA